MSKVDLNQILSIISETIQEPASKININSKACDFPKWDSLSQVTMMIKLKRKLKRKLIQAKFQS